jgi:hypothetical protein
MSWYAVKTRIDRDERQWLKMMFSKKIIWNIFKINLERRTFHNTLMKIWSIYQHNFYSFDYLLLFDLLINSFIYSHVNQYTKSRLNHSMISFIYEFKSNSLAATFERASVDELFIRQTHSFNAFSKTFNRFSAFSVLLFDVLIWSNEIFSNFCSILIILVMSMTSWFDTISNFFFNSKILIVNIFLIFESITNDWTIDEKTSINDWNENENAKKKLRYNSYES